MTEVSRDTIIDEMESELESVINRLECFDTCPARDVGTSAGRMATALNHIQYRLRLLREPVEEPEEAT
jgi:hypothetical protein